MIKAFTAESSWHKYFRYVTEDSYKIPEDRSVIAVADGVTRDPLKILPNYQTVTGKIIFSLFYPRPSPAKQPADIFCNSFTGFSQITGRKILLVFMYHQKLCLNIFHGSGCVEKSNRLKRKIF